MIHCRHIDADKGRHIETLREAVAIKSVSAWPNSRPEISKMIDWTVAKLKALGTTIELVDLGEETLLDGTKIPLPNAILGQLGNVNYFFTLKSLPIRLINLNLNCRIQVREPFVFTVIWMFNRHYCPMAGTQSRLF